MRVGAGAGGIGIAGVLPLGECILRVRITGGDVFALRVVRVAERGHARERIATLAVGVAEVVLGGHIAAHPLRGLLQRNGDLKGSGAVLRAKVVDQGDECGLFRIQGWGLCVGQSAPSEAHT